MDSNTNQNREINMSYNSNVAADPARNLNMGANPSVNPSMATRNPNYNYYYNPDGALHVVETKKPDTEETKKLKEGFGIFGPVTFAYAVLYAFCMFKNDAGLSFPFFMAGSLFYLCFMLNRLGISLKKGSVFYMISMMLLAVSTFCTDDPRIIGYNKTGIFLLIMSLLLKQYCDTSKWKLGKYLLEICQLVFGCLGDIYRPFSDMSAYFKTNQSRKTKNIWYVMLGIVVAIPIFLVVLWLLSSADAVFRNMTEKLLRSINLENICNVTFRILFIYVFAYMLTSFLCRRKIDEGVKDRKNGEPIIAIVITGLLSLLYVVFSGVQILYLFIGNMKLPENYTYAEYAREGFFQLLAVGILNLVIVLVALSFFKESKILKGILTVMSLCSFVMIASSAMRMIIYIQYYYLTFLRILVLWALFLLFCLFIGVILEIFGKKFNLFTYSMVTVTVLYLALSFSHPDYIIASFNVANAQRADGSWTKSGFIESSEPYKDYGYLCSLSADAAPVLIPYLRDELGMDMEPWKRAVEDPEYDIFQEEQERRLEMAKINGVAEVDGRYLYDLDDGYTFGYYYLENIRERLRHLNLRTFNVSRFMALKQIASTK